MQKKDRGERNGEGMGRYGPFGAGNERNYRNAQEFSFSPAR